MSLKGIKRIKAARRAAQTERGAIDCYSRNLASGVWSVEKMQACLDGEILKPAGRSIEDVTAALARMTALKMRESHARLRVGDGNLFSTLTPEQQKRVRQAKFDKAPTFYEVQP